MTSKELFDVYVSQTSNHSASMHTDYNDHLDLDVKADDFYPEDFHVDTDPDDSDDWDYSHDDFD